MPYTYKYPHPAVTTDCVIFAFDRDELHVLLIQRGNEPQKGRWAFPGGFLNIDESADDGALRELREETGLEAARAHQFHAFAAPGRDPRERVISIAYLSLTHLRDVKGGDDAANARWYALGDVPPLAFDHDRMLLMAVRRLRSLLLYEPETTDYLSADFTADELQRIGNICTEWLSTRAGK